MADGFVEGAEIADEFDPAQETAEQQIQRKLSDANQKLVDNLRRRQEAYKRLFQGQPLGDDVLIVVRDLQAFCRGDASTFDQNERVHALLTGRQEVYLRIMDHTRLDFDALLQKYTQPL